MKCGVFLHRFLSQYMAHAGPVLENGGSWELVREDWRKVFHVPYLPLQFLHPDGLALCGSILPANEPIP